VHVTAVLFDLGGTLFSYEARDQLGRASVAAFARMGLSPDDPAVRDARRRAFRQVEEEYAARPSFLHRDLFRDRIARTAELLGVSPSADVLDQFDREHRQAMVDHLGPRPDARDTLEGLRARGLYVAVVSNADADDLEAMLRRHGFETLVDDWTSSEEAGSCKPDPRIYEYALSKAGRPAAEALFVGDSLQHDVAGADRVGMRTVLIGEPGATAPLSSGFDRSVAADFEVRTLTEVLGIVDGYEGRP
jgi:putative hydrolase of the HAD superfamily